MFMSVVFVSADSRELVFVIFSCSCFFAVFARTQEASEWLNPALGTTFKKTAPTQRHSKETSLYVLNIEL